MVASSDNSPLIDLDDAGDIESIETSLRSFGLEFDLEDDSRSSSSELDHSATEPILNVELTKRQAQKQTFNLFVDEQACSKENETKPNSENIADGKSADESQRIIDKAREYQQELFERAQEENIIAVLETGSGKTLIACLLARWTLEQERIVQAFGRAPRRIFFLANSNHLVQQGGRFMARNLSENVIWLTGNGRQDLSKQAVWKHIFETYSLVVCTPAILEQCLMRAFLEISQISLLIFDEAHHAKKDHPYGKLIRSYYMKCDKSARPKIFGMTASPVDSKGEITTTAQALEELLHSKIVTSDDMSLLSFAPKPLDVQWVYPKLRMEFETDLYQRLSLLCRFCEDLSKGFEFTKKATAQLGPWCADRAWNYYFNISTFSISSVRKKYEESVAYSNLATAEEKAAALAALDKASFLVQNYQYGQPTMSFLHLSPKVILLHQELSRIYEANADTRAIVFVNERLKAILLHDLFQKLKVSNLRPGILLGIAGGNESSSVRNQEQILDHFRTGSVNLVFATSVADEGLDIPQCNLCIRFDLCKTTIQYMQSRGRARMKDSIFVHMIEADNESEITEVDFQIADAQYVKNWCAGLPPDRLLGKGTKLAKLIAKDSANRSFKTLSGAICDFSNSLLIVARFAASLKHTGASHSETYEEEIDHEQNLFRYVVRLPRNSESKVKGCRGEWRPNKQLAKRSAAFGVCYLLREAGELDTNLDSIFKKVKPENLNAHLAVSGKEDSYVMQVKPTIWQEDLGIIPTQLYATIVCFRCTDRAFAPLVFLTRRSLPTLPSFCLYVDGFSVEVNLDTHPEPVKVSNNELRLLTVFTLDGVFSDVFNKIYEHEPQLMSYWLAPKRDSLQKNTSTLKDLIDTQALYAADKERLQWTSGMEAQEWSEKFLCDPLNGKFHYLTGQVVPNASVFDPIPPDVPKLADKKMGSVIDFSDSTWTASKKKAALERKYDIHQPVLAADLVGTRRDFLRPTTEKDFIPCHIAPQTLQVARIEAAFALSCLAWPAILHRIESYLIALEAFEKLELSNVPADLALEALTKDADDDKDETKTHTGDKRGMGKSYERLEFLGDSLLKLTTTMAVFNRTICDEEGMHCRRMEILCNRRLYDVSTDLELFKYARTKSFNRNTWYPENLTLLRGRGAKKPPQPVKHSEMTQGLSMKTIADISEAIIGAAIVTSRSSANKFDLGIQAITKLVRSEDHDVASWDDIRKMYTAPEWSLLTNDPVANDLASKVRAKTGYYFNHPRLLRSAFTHSSNTSAPVPDLQRLEFLGDAVLDWVCISWLFDSNPSKNPQWLTEHKMAMVSNKFLAALAVVLDFDKFVFITTPQLLNDIQTYAEKVREARSNPAACRPDFWTRIDHHPPKALSDLVESYVGAVLIDSNFDYAEIEAFFDAHVKQFFVDIEAYDTFANRHPTTYLYKKLADEFKCRDFSVLESKPKEGLIELEITAGVLVHTHVVAFSKGASGKYAKVRASKQALALLEGMTREEFRRKYGCDCKSKGKE